MAVNWTESAKRFSMSTSGKMTQSAISGAKSMEQAALKAADSEIKLAQKGALNATEEMAEAVRKRAMADGEKLVKQLEKAVLKNADASERAAEGQAFAKADHTFDWDAYGTDGLESLPMWGALSEEQQNRLKNLEAIGDTGMMIDQYDHIVRQMDLDNRMFGTYQMKDLLMDYEKEIVGI